MKSVDDERRGVLSRLAELVTRNWGLKLLSLVLAIIIYQTLKPSGDGAPVAPDVRFHAPETK